MLAVAEVAEDGHYDPSDENGCERLDDHAQATPVELGLERGDGLGEVEVLRDFLPPVGLVACGGQPFLVETAPNALELGEGILLALLGLRELALEPGLQIRGRLAALHHLVALGRADGPAADLVVELAHVGERLTTDLQRELATGRVQLTLSRSVVVDSHLSVRGGGKVLHHRDLLHELDELTRDAVVEAGEVEVPTSVLRAELGVLELGVVGPHRCPVLLSHFFF